MKLAQLEYHIFPHSDSEDDYFFPIRGNCSLNSEGIANKSDIILVPDLNVGTYEDRSLTFNLLVHISNWNHKVDGAE